MINFQCQIAESDSVISQIHMLLALIFLTTCYAGI